MSHATSTHSAPKRSRAEWHRVFVGLREQGVSGVQIARRFGLSSSFVNGVLGDPHGSKDRARKASYGGICKGCGARTDGSNGKSKAPELCAKCAPDARRFWTRAEIIAAIRAWARENGRPPSASDWRAAGADHPAASNVYGGHRNDGRRPVFASWADAIEAAGFARPLPAHYDRRGARGLGAVERDVLELAEDGPVTAPWLHDEVGIQPSTARHALAALHRRGLLTRDEKGEGRTYVYRHATPAH